MLNARARARKERHGGTRQAAIVSNLTPNRAIQAAGNRAAGIESMFNLCAASLSPASSCRRTGRNQALYRQRRASNAEDAGDAKAADEDAEDDEGEDAESTALFSKVYVPLLHAAGGNLTPPQVDKLQADFVQAAPRDPSFSTGWCATCA